MRVEIEVYLVDHPGQFKLRIGQTTLILRTPAINTDRIVRYVEIHYCYKCLLESEQRRLLCINT